MRRANLLHPLVLGLGLGLLLTAPLPQALASDLPTLGDATSAILSPQDEARLGDTWARMLRGQTQQLEDPVIYSYIEDLLWKLVAHSQIQNRHLELILIDNKTLNAFAVPGGIVGVQGGLLLSTEDEDELASVLAHELAHLSQHHFAQQLQQERQNRPLMLAALLGSILVASADGQAGAAAISSTLGASEMSRLAFSRQNEQEADRFGMKTLAASGFDPHAMPRMFEQLQKSMRFNGDNPPEFLLTHPVTQSRIADAENRAAQLPPAPPHKATPDFTIVRIRAQVHFAEHPESLLASFEAAERDSHANRDRYGIAMAAAAAGQYDRALKALDRLSGAWKHHIYVDVSRAEILHQAGRDKQALALLKQLDELYPDSLPIQKTYARVAQAAGQTQQAIRLYEQVLDHYPNDTDARFNLAECYGLAHRILKVHETRIEYFLRTAQVDKALRQIDFALKEKQLSDSDRARLSAYREDARRLQKNMKMDF